MEQVLQQIREERERQRAKYPDEQRRLADMFWNLIFVEEVGEVSTAICDKVQGRSHNLEEELVQVATVAVAWLEDIEAKKREGIHD